MGVSGGRLPRIPLFRSVATLYRLSIVSGTKTVALEAFMEWLCESIWQGNIRVHSLLLDEVKTETYHALRLWEGASEGRQGNIVCSTKEAYNWNHPSQHALMSLANALPF